MISTKLNKLINNEKSTHYKNYNLNSIKLLLKYFNNPHDKIKTIHIAGTNGKGSVAHSMASIFKSSGYKVGLYTSPHLSRFNERIKINDIEITDNVFNNYINEIFNFIEKDESLNPNFFDVLTLIAFNYFFDQKVDIAIVETGLGGRIDSTNVVTPLCSIITDIAMDHNHILGDTIEKISEEKCGIIKENVPVVTSNEDAKVLSIIEKYSKNRSSELFKYKNNFHVNNISVIQSGFCFNYQFEKNNSSIQNIEIPLPGEFQYKNMSLSITASLLLAKKFPNISIESIKTGLKNLKIPGRFEILHEKPLTIFDPAHNPMAMDKVIKILRTRYSKSKKIIVILSLMKDKNYSEIINMLKKNKFKIIYYPLKDDRSYQPSKEDVVDFEIIDDMNDMFQKIQNTDHNNLLLFFTGSFRLYDDAVNFVKKFG